MRINKTFIRTSQNYGLNDFEVPDNTFNGITDKKNYVKDENLPKYPLCDACLSQLKNCGESIEISLDGKEKITTLNIKEDFICKAIKITAEENVDAKVVITFENNLKAFNNSYINFICKKNSKVEVVILTSFEKTSTNFLTIENDLDENSKISVIYTDFSCDYSVLRYISNLYKDNCQSYFKNLYIGKDENKIDINISKNVYGKNCKCDIQTIGALFDKASKSYKGLIDFKKGCKGSVGDEKELALTFSKQTKSKALPLLLSSEDDVKGSHSSATGKINEQMLFYVMSRGLTRKQAVLLLLKAKMATIIDEIFDDKLKRVISKELERRINYEN